MIKSFVEKYTKLIVNHPDDVRIEEQKQSETFVAIAIYVHPEDMGKVIGKNANMISAINTFIGACFVKNKISYKAFVKSTQED